LVLCHCLLNQLSLLPQAQMNNTGKMAAAQFRNLNILKFLDKNGIFVVLLSNVKRSQNYCQIT
jgi:hypothetical protein